MNSPVKEIQPSFITNALNANEPWLLQLLHLDK